eukprot:4097024-Alexandrium_andersonii.AAC.1
MSASLVGSEMCIRDRLTRCPTSSAAVARRCDPARRLAARGAAQAAAKQPVSYTHLTLPTICSV